MEWTWGNRISSMKQPKGAFLRPSSWHDSRLPTKYEILQQQQQQQQQQQKQKINNPAAQRRTKRCNVSFKVQFQATNQSIFCSMEVLKTTIRSKRISIWTLSELELSHETDGEIQFTLCCWLDILVVLCCCAIFQNKSLNWTLTNPCQASQVWTCCICAW